jgi:hypothetical protein
MAKPPESHPEFGRLICSRGYGILYWGVGPALVLLGLPFLVFGLLGPFSLYHGRQKSVGMDIIFPLVFAALGGVVACAGIGCLRSALTRLHFFEHGVVRRRPGRRLSVPYQDATSLTYQLTRQFINGVYAGTSLKLGLRATDGRKISYSGSHKERAAGLFTIVTKQFKGTDEMDAVRSVIAGFVADRMQERLLDGATFDWCGGGSISPDGITPRRGKFKNQLVPWTEIDRQSAQKGFFYLFRRGEDKSFAGAAVNAKDFWPYLELIARMVRAQSPGAAIEACLPAVGAPIPA